MPTFGVKPSSPAEGVIRVVARHWDGASTTPGFDLNTDDATNKDHVFTQVHGSGDGELGENGASVSLVSGALKTTVIKGFPFRLAFEANGTRLTGSGFRSLGRFKLNELSPVSAAPVGEL
ncbi:hypothetical protein [Bifidobacterium sp. ESL0764]|uniref:hypothetical protein n=1 Tax=Bifidobacterium sp. ESL0764 TaxID=2983228 RepID=UPI0023F63B90|nr:hypothetical protein [Bifidobacterium sp. ESL0764]WEV65214.1 hypothetical protein OZX71_05395 [Bifidobacterium sp. ESL0764]